MTSTTRRRVRGRRRHLARLALVAVLALATGCGGTDDEQQQQPQQSAAEAWADDVCSSVSTWQDAVAQSRSVLGDPADLSADDVRQALEGAATATSTLVADLEQIGPPDTEAGKAAAAELSTLSDQLRQQADLVTRALDRSSGDLQELLAQLSAVSGALSTMATDAATAIDNLSRLDGAEELQSAFRTSPTCQQLGAGASPSG